MDGVVTKRATTDRMEFLNKSDAVVPLPIRIASIHCLSLLRRPAAEHSKADHSRPAAASRHSSPPLQGHPPTLSEVTTFAFLSSSAATSQPALEPSPTYTSSRPPYV